MRHGPPSSGSDGFSTWTRSSTQPRAGSARTDAARSSCRSPSVEVQHGQYPSPDGYVFTSPERKMVRHRNFLADHFDPAREKVRHLMPPGFRCYDLRHTHASLLISRGWRSEQVAERLGHASTKDNVRLVRAPVRRP